MPRLWFGWIPGVVDDSIAKITEFVHQVVLERKDFAIRGWRRWVLEDPLVHPYRWLSPDNVPPAPFLSCDPNESVMVLVCWLALMTLIGSFGRHGCPFSVVETEGELILVPFRLWLRSSPPCWM